MTDTTRQTPSSPEVTTPETEASISPAPTHKKSRLKLWLWLIFIVGLIGISLPYLNVHVYSLQESSESTAAVEQENISPANNESSSEQSVSVQPGVNVEEATDAETPDAPVAENTAPSQEASSTVAEEPQTASATDTISEQEARIKALEEKLAAVTTVDPAAQQQAALVTQQAQQTMELMRGQVELLQQQLENVKQQTQQQGLPVRQLQLWVVLSQLKSAIERGVPTMPLVVQLREGWVESEPGELAALRQLVEASSYRIPTEAALLQDFHQLRQDVASSILNENVGIWYRLKAILRDHIRIRRINSESNVAATNDPLQLLNEAEMMIAAGEIKAAIENVNALPTGRTAFESWLSNANRLVDSRRSVTVLENSLLDSMQAMPMRENIFPTPAVSEDESDTPPTDDAASAMEKTVE